MSTRRWGITGAMLRGTYDIISWWAIVHGVSKSQTQLSICAYTHTHTHTHIHTCTHTQTHTPHHLQSLNPSFSFLISYSSPTGTMPHQQQSPTNSSYHVLISFFPLFYLKYSYSKANSIFLYFFLSEDSVQNSILPPPLKPK